MVGPIVRHVFNVAECLPFNDIKLKRLADLLNALKKGAPLKSTLMCNSLAFISSGSIATDQPNLSQDSQLGFDDRPLLEKAFETWHSYHCKAPFHFAA